MDYLDMRSLYHHGIEGQQWGVRNGPPYPLDPEDRSAAEKQEDEEYQAKQKRKKIAIAAIAAAGILTVGIVAARRSAVDKAKAEELAAKAAKEAAIQSEREAAAKRYNQRLKATSKVVSKNKKAYDLLDKVSKGDIKSIDKLNKTSLYGDPVFESRKKAAIKHGKNVVNLNKARKVKEAKRMAREINKKELERIGSIINIANPFSL